MIDTQQMKRPEGSVVLHGCTIDGPGIFMQAVAGAHVFRLILDSETQTMTFVHSSPGTGTRSTTAKVAPILSAMLSQKVFLGLTWSPESLALYVGIEGAGGELITSASTVACLPTLLTDRNGGVYEIGSAGVEVQDARVWVGGAQEVAPSAIDLWRATCEWSDTILGVLPEKDGNYHTEVAVANAGFVALVSGYEVYLQERFRELDLEGLTLEREKLRKRLAREVSRAEEGPAEQFVDLLVRAINFQSWSKAKDAYAQGYGLVFGKDLGLETSDFERIQRLLTYRHRMIHANPMTSMLNPMFPKEVPEFAGKAFVAKAEVTLGRFVDALHDATLRLRPA